jgi:hypothetical protein
MDRDDSTAAERRKVRDARAKGAKDCTCGDGPVVSEDAGGGKWRIVCCYCWRKTTPRTTSDRALAAWNAGEAR